MVCVVSFNSLSGGNGQVLLEAADLLFLNIDQPAQTMLRSMRVNELSDLVRHRRCLTANRIGRSPEALAIRQGIQSYSINERPRAERSCPCKP